jgi:hypothetical protein
MRRRKVTQIDTIRTKLGEIVISISGLDFWIEILLRDLLKLDDETNHIVLADMSLKHKQDLLSRLYPLKVTSYNKKEFERTIMLIDTIRSQRNILMHSWWINKKNGGLSIISLKKKHKRIYHDSKLMNENDMDNLLKIIKTTCELLERQYDQLMNMNYVK